MAADVRAIARYEQYHMRLSGGSKHKTTEDGHASWWNPVGIVREIKRSFKDFQEVGGALKQYKAALDNRASMPASQFKKAAMHMAHVVVGTRESDVNVFISHRKYIDKISIKADKAVQKELRDNPDTQLLSGGGFLVDKIMGVFHGMGRFIGWLWELLRKAFTEMDISAAAKLFAMYVLGCFLWGYYHGINWKSGKEDTWTTSSKPICLVANWGIQQLASTIFPTLFASKLEKDAAWYTGAGAGAGTGALTVLACGGAAAFGLGGAIFSGGMSLAAAGAACTAVGAGAGFWSFKNAETGALLEGQSWKLDNIKEHILPILSSGGALMLGKLFVGAGDKSHGMHRKALDSSNAALDTVLSVHPGLMPARRYQQNYMDTIAGKERTYSRLTDKEGGLMEHFSFAKAKERGAKWKYAAEKEEGERERSMSRRDRSRSRRKFDRKHASERRDFEIKNERQGRAKEMAKWRGDPAKDEAAAERKRLQAEARAEAKAEAKYKAEAEIKEEAKLRARANAKARAKARAKASYDSDDSGSVADRLRRNPRRRSTRKLGGGRRSPTKKTTSKKKKKASPRKKKKSSQKSLKKKKTKASPKKKTKASPKKKTKASPKKGKGRRATSRGRSRSRSRSRSRR